VADTTTSIFAYAPCSYGYDFGGRISADGSYLAFSTHDQWYEQGTTCLHDRVTGANTIMAGGSDNSGSRSDAISADGRYVALTSSELLVSEDLNNADDVFVYDRKTGNITGVSISPAGDQEDLFQGSWKSAISADGRNVAFHSENAKLITGDDGDGDFVRDRLLNTTTTADLQVTVTAKPASVRKSQTASYRLTVKNNGTNSAGNVALTDIVSNGTVLTTTPSQGACSTAAISVCRLNTLAAGASATVAVTIRADACSLTQKISVSAAPKDNAMSNNTVWISTPVIIP